MIRFIRLTGWLLFSVFLVCLVVVSPILFELIQPRYSDSRWTTISAIGQSYGFAAAILSALAFVGAFATFRLQRIEAKANREQNARTSHLHLLELALTDDVLLQTWRLATEKVSDEELRKRIYINMIFSHWQTLYELDMLDDSELEANARTLFEDSTARYYWSIAMIHRRNAVRNASDRAFLAAVDRAYN